MHVPRTCFISGDKPGQGTNQAPGTPFVALAETELQGMEPGHGQDQLHWLSELMLIFVVLKYIQSHN